MENPAVKNPVNPEIIKRAQQGDADAFAIIFNAHKALVYSRCLRMTNSVTEAEDLTQDAFIQVFRKISTFRGDSALSTWLYRIAINTVLMHFRKKTPRNQSLDSTATRDSAGKLTPREYGMVDGRLSRSVERLALARAIQDLPDGYKTVFLLHEVQGYEHAEIARLLGCSTGNSKSQLHKAKLRIRKTLTPAEAQATSRHGRRAASARTARNPILFPAAAMASHRPFRNSELDVAA